MEANQVTKMATVTKAQLEKQNKELLQKMQEMQLAMDAMLQEKAKNQEQQQHEEKHAVQDEEKVPEQVDQEDASQDEQVSDSEVGTPRPPQRPPPARATTRKTPMRRSQRSAKKANKSDVSEVCGEDNEVDKLLQPQADKQVVSAAQKAVPVLKDHGTNGSEWKHRFYDYLDAMGLKAAVRATEVTEVQETKRAIQREQSRSLVSDLRDREDDRPRWCAAYQTLKTSLSTGNYQTYVVYEAEANPDQDFFDLWAKCLQLIGATGRYQNLTYARTALDTDTLQQGDTITSLAQRIQSRVATVNSMAGNRVISDQDANYHLLKAVKGSSYSNCFQTANTKAESNYPNWTWATMVQKFVVYSPKDVLGREMPMGPRHENEKPATESLAMAAEPQGARPNGKEKCGFCERQGHKENECWTKASAKQAYLNKKLPPKQHPPPPSQSNAGHRECWEWKSKGSCGYAARTGRTCKFRHGDAKEGDQANAAEPPPQGPADVASMIKTELLKLLQSRDVPSEARGQASMAVGDESLAGVLSLVHDLPAGFTSMAASSPEGDRAIILDSGCSRSCVTDPSQLQELKSAPRQMWTANGGHSSATHEGRLASRIPALAKIQASLIPDFRKGLVSLGDMDELGIVWQGGGGTWSFYDSDGEFLVQVTKGTDNLWHFPDKAFGRS